MSRKTSAYVKGISAGLMVGGIAFAATKALASHRKPTIKMTAGRAFKALGSIIESI